MHERDAQDALGIAEKQWRQYQHLFNFKWRAPRDIHDVVIAGMGGSDLAGKFLPSWPGLKVPLTILQDYILPKHVTTNTLLVCCSYSGNTEETLSVLKQAMSDKSALKIAPMVIVVSSGGQELELAKQAKLPVIVIPHDLQPRFAFGYQLRALIEILEQTPLLKASIQELTGASNFVKSSIEGWLPTVPTKSNQAKQIAQELIGRSVVVYSGTLLAPSAYKWKININENAKQIAWQGTLPEFNHNEMLGWSEQPVQKPYAVIDLRTNLDHPRVQKRFKVSERLLSGKRPAAIVVDVQGKNPIEQLLWAVALGDFVSIYLALLNNLNPTPVDLVEKFKKALDE
ncbi:MAG TPA: bifunctional phosphoglucose/phosphomannose isomerase [Candidatus Saccharimonadales bacterium]|nr:bifunctional phosphoglucose/phosphomannose isomerase [Candidatus Saccharimonadales bacterium]